MAISSAIWSSPRLPVHRSPTIPLRELAAGRAASWSSPKPRASPRFLVGHRRQISNATKGLALPRRIRRPANLAILLGLISLVVLWILAGQAARVVTTASHVVAVAPALAYHVSMRPWRAWRARRQERLAKLHLPASANHLYHPNGLVVVNQRGTHPILGMIEKAEKEWKAKVARQSKTLEEATIEYKRRYKRNPPRGWDKWCVAGVFRSASPLTRAQVGLCHREQCPARRRVRPDRP
jgi:hypothetical protein